MTSDYVKVMKFTQNDEFKYLQRFHSKLNFDCKSTFKVRKLKFNNCSGDITKGIIWTWAINDESYYIFTRFFDKINLINNLNSLFNNYFEILGISFITLNKNEIKNNQSFFHHDILSPYDTDKTNILTVLIPLQISSGMGGLEYMIDEDVIKYNYKIGEYIVFDSSKVKHRTMPFKISSAEKRVLLSVNLSSKAKWAITATINNTSHQGNILTL